MYDDAAIVPFEPIILASKQSYHFDDEFEHSKITIEWVTKQQVICDLDLTLFCYDERARLVERIDSHTVNLISKDGSCVLNKPHYDETSASTSHLEHFNIDFNLVSKQISSILLYLDGGTRNFQFLQHVNVQGCKIFPNRYKSDFLPSEDDNNGLNGPIFKFSTKTRKAFQGLVLCCIYKDGWNKNLNISKWAITALMDPLYVTSLKDKQEKCNLIVINSVPALEKFRPRLFNSILDVCAALSSHALPKLKKKFQKGDGLPIGPFTEVLFKQLFESHPKIIEEAEAAYTVAMIQEMFYQIDYNDDGSCNWDEFTSFCVQTGLLTSSGKNRSNNYALEQYVIEYQEQILERDHILSAYRYVSLMRHIPELRKIVVIAEDADNVMVFDEKFRIHAQLYPYKIQTLGSFSTKLETEIKEKQIKNPNHIRVAIYDMIYLTGRELYGYCSSDHSITICKEFSSMGGKKVSYQLFNRFYHTLLHLKLCWSSKQNLLCSVASDKVIFGWNIDTGAILFQVSRHNDIITDFIAVDHLNLFMTCSMDKRICLWSSISRRVKGMLVGHKRGVRTLSVYEHLLLSAGFECDARLWELVNKDCIAILKGHRNPIVCAKLMCDRAQSEREHRAVTVDETGEFRLWNIHVREKASEAVLLPTLQVFEMTHPEPPLNRFRFLELPFNIKSSTSYYSDIVACGTKLLHFIPEKIVKEFVAPTASVYNDFFSSILTAYSKSLITYDIGSGEFISVFEDFVTNDITALCLDGSRGRKMYIGTIIGEVFLINSSNGAVIDSIHYHTKDVTSLYAKVTTRNCVYSSSMDGHIRLYEEANGKLHLHHSYEYVFGENIGITQMKFANSLNVIIAVGTGNQWGVFHDTSLKKIFVISQNEMITAIEIIGSSHDKVDEEYRLSLVNNSHQELLNLEKESLLTVAIATSSCIYIYTISVEDIRGVKAFELLHDAKVEITDLTWLKSPDINSINYSSVRSNNSNKNNSNNNITLKDNNYFNYQLVASTDDGNVIIWDTTSLRYQSELKYKIHYKGVTGRRQAMLNAIKQTYSHSIKQDDNESSSDMNSRSTSISDTSSSVQLDGGFLAYTLMNGLNNKKNDNNNNDDDNNNHQQSSPFSRNPSERNINRTNSGIDNNNRRSKLIKSKSMKKPIDIKKKIKSVTSSIIANRKQIRQNMKKKIETTTATAAAAAVGGDVTTTLTNNNLKIVTGMEILNQSTSLQQQQQSRGLNRTSPNSSLILDNVSIKSYVEFSSDEICPVPKGQKFPIYLKSTKSYIAHIDTIPEIICLPAHGCYVTVSHDGYHRVWNLDMQCLGELPLPNLTDQMKSTSILLSEPGSTWKFILERIPVTQQHIDKANILTRFLKQSRKEKAAEFAAEQRRMGGNFACFKPFGADIYEEEDTEQTLLRKEKLREMLEPPQPSDEVPPARLPTKEEKELLRLSLTLEEVVSTSNNNSPRSESESTSKDNKDDDDDGRKKNNSGKINNITTTNTTTTTAVTTKSTRNNTNDKKITSKANITSTTSTTITTEKDITPNLSSSSSSPPQKTLKLRPLLRTSSGKIMFPKIGADGTTDNIRASFLGIDTQNVLINIPGIRGLWSIPGERDIFGNLSQCIHSNTPDFVVPAPFTDASIKSLLKDKMIDSEGTTLLRRVAKSIDRVHVYDRSQPTLLVRSPYLSTSVTLPSLDSIRKTEICFGQQKDMYKNAEKVLNDKENISKTQVQSAVAKSRIDLNVRQIKSMIHLIQPPSHDEVILPKSKENKEMNDEALMDSEELHKLRSEEQKMKIRLMRSHSLIPPEALANARPLDKNSIDKWTLKLHTAIESFGDNLPKDNAMRRKQRDNLSQSAVHHCEKKLQSAIRGHYRAHAAKLRKNRAMLDVVDKSTTTTMPTTPKSALKQSSLHSISSSTSTVQFQQQPSSPKSGSHTPSKIGNLFYDDSQDAYIEEHTPWDDDDVNGGDGNKESSMYDPSTYSINNNSMSNNNPFNKKPTEKKFVLTTRMLLPYYKLDAVHQFMDIFAKVDENFSGDIDVNEWIKLFASLSDTVSELESRMIFMKIDKDSDGFLTMRELIPVVFSKANKEQQRRIIQYTELELTKKIATENVPKVTHTDLELLFEAYDSENIGFVEVGFIKERIRTFYLSEQNLFYFMEGLNGFVDDEMLNLLEFKRVFREYISSKG